MTGHLQSFWYITLALTDLEKGLGLADEDAIEEVLSNSLRTRASLYRERYQ